MILSIHRDAQTNDKQDIAAAVLTWTIVIALPIAIAAVTHWLFPALHWVFKSLLPLSILGVLFIISEWIFQLMRRIFCPERNHIPNATAYTAEQTAAKIASNVITDENCRVSSLMKNWPESNNQLVNELHSLLNQCADVSTDAFDQRKVNENLQRLSEMMNQLRS